jgi:hypothetical protein
LAAVFIHDLIFEAVEPTVFREGRPQGCSVYAVMRRKHGWIRGLGPLSLQVSPVLDHVVVRSAVVVLRRSVLDGRRREGVEVDRRKLHFERSHPIRRSSARGEAERRATAEAHGQGSERESWE